eukprot:m.19965 g.19965  ORF g.19965 m.19965 type:complete len:529 (-) comp3791_c0_seq1:68-1654(-)
MAEVPNDGREVAGPFLISSNRFGSGRYGHVFQAIHQPSGELIAAKVIPKSELVSSMPRNRVLRAVQVAYQLQHPNVCRVLWTSESASKVFIFMEPCEGGTLLDHLRATGGVSEPEALGYFHQLVAALTYCHSRGVIHRNIKLDNILFDHGRVKLTNFSCARELSRHEIIHTIQESPHFVAPEVVLGTDTETYDARQTDVWHLGVALFACLCGRLPFVHTQLKPLCHKIVAHRPKYPSSLSAESRNLLERMLNKDPNLRITLEGVQRHPWFAMLPQVDAFESERTAATLLPVVQQEMYSLGFTTPQLDRAMEAEPYRSLDAVVLHLVRRRLSTAQSDLHVVPGNLKRSLRRAGLNEDDEDDAVVPEVPGSASPPPVRRLCAPPAYKSAVPNIADADTVPEQCTAETEASPVVVAFDRDEGALNVAEFAMPATCPASPTPTEAASAFATAPSPSPPPREEAPPMLGEDAVLCSSSPSQASSRSATPSPSPSTPHKAKRRRIGGDEASASSHMYMPVEGEHALSDPVGLEH